MKKFLKVACYGGCFAAALLIGAHYTWKLSGSAQWRLVSDEDGVRVYEMKEPGATFMKYKASMRMKSTMNRIVAGMMDRDLKSCAEWNPGCVSEQTVQAWDQQERSFVHFYRVNLPSPMAPREFLLKAQFTPDTQDRSVFIQYTAMPDELPRNDCCYRVSHMNNTWRFTPAAKGEIEVDFMQDMDVGMPYFVYNRLAPGFVHDGLLSLPRILNQSKYDRENTLFATATTVPTLATPTTLASPIVTTKTPPSAFATAAFK
jgi:hypothetical protein